MKVNFIAVDVPQAPAKAWHYAIIFAYYKLQSVNFQKLVLPHNNVGKLFNCTNFWKKGYIPEALLGNTNSNGREIHNSFDKYCIATVTKLVLAAWKGVIVVTIGFAKFAKTLIVKIKFLKLTVKSNGFAATT